MEDYSNYSLSGQSYGSDSSFEKYRDYAATLETAREEDFRGGDLVPGLSKAHSGPFGGDITAWKGGGLIRVSRPKLDRGQVGGGKRGKVTSFTKGARRRMMYELAKLDRSKLPVYVVLTFPDEYFPNNSDGKISQRILRAFIRRLKRRFPGCGAIVRREHERRKSGRHVGEYFPHYNLLIWGASELDLRVWLPSAWWDVCGRLCDAHRGAGTYIKLVESWRQMSYYISKYVAKLDDYHAEGWGLWWGFVNRSFLPWVAAVSRVLDDRGAVRLIRYAKRKAGIRRNLRSVSLMTSNPDFWIDRLYDLIL